MLPPGQKARADFPRFGLPPFADRFPSNLEKRLLDIDINKSGVFTIDLDSADIPRSRITADFHCVTTWSYLQANWTGVRFTEFYNKHIKPLEGNTKPLIGVVVHAQDGYKTSLLLEDLLNEDVLLADSFDDELLSIEHGAPLRLVVPQHYGYKNLKHLTRIEFYSELPVIKRGLRAFLDHPRGRVAQEERGRWIPGSVLRFVYRPLIAGTVREFASAMNKHDDRSR